MHVSIVKLLISVLMCYSMQGLATEPENARPFTINTQIIPPYTTENNNGFEDLLAIKLFRQMGFNLVISHVPEERGLLNLNQGLDDAILSRVAGLEKIYPNIIQLNEVAVEWRFVAFTKRNDMQIRSWDDFEPYDVAHVTGWKIFEQNIRKYRSLIRVHKARQLFQLLNANRVDVVVYALRPGKWLIKNLGIKNVHALKPDLASKKKYFYVHKRHRERIPEADSILKQFKEEGIYNQLYNMTMKDKGFE